MQNIHHQAVTESQSSDPRIATLNPSLHSKAYKDAISLSQEIVLAMIETVLAKRSKNPSDLVTYDFTREVLLRILHYTNLPSLSRCRQVSVRWNQIACDPTLEDEKALKSYVPSFLTIFDKADWNAYYDVQALGLNFDDLPSLNHHMISSLLQKLNALSGFEVNTEFTLLAVPKGLTYCMLEEFAKHPKQGFPIRFRAIWQVYINEYGQVPVEKSYRVLISHKALTATKGIAVVEKVKKIKEIGCEVPKTLELILLQVITYLKAYKRLFATGHFDFSICEEKFENICFQVGGYLGINVSYDPIPETSLTRSDVGAAFVLRNIN